MARPRKPMRVTLINEDALRRIAHIIGDHSAARLALDDLARRRERGEDPVAIQHGESILVVPRADLIPVEALSPSTQDRS